MTDGIGGAGKNSLDLSINEATNNKRTQTLPSTGQKDGRKVSGDEGKSRSKTLPLSSQSLPVNDQKESREIGDDVQNTTIDRRNAQPNPAGDDTGEVLSFEVEFDGADGIEIVSLPIDTENFFKQDLKMPKCDPMLGTEKLLAQGFLPSDGISKTMSLAETSMKVLQKNCGDTPACKSTNFFVEKCHAVRKFASICWITLSTKKHSKLPSSFMKEARNMWGKIAGDTKVKDVSILDALEQTASNYDNCVEQLNKVEREYKKRQLNKLDKSESSSLKEARAELRSRRKQLKKGLAVFTSASLRKGLTSIKKQTDKIMVQTDDKALSERQRLAPEYKRLVSNVLVGLENLVEQDVYNVILNNFEALGSKFFGDESDRSYRHDDEPSVGQSGLKPNQNRSRGDSATEEESEGLSFANDSYGLFDTDVSDNQNKPFALPSSFANDSYGLFDTDVSDNQNKPFALPSYSDVDSYDLDESDVGSYDLDESDVGSYDTKKWYNNVNEWENEWIKHEIELCGDKENSLKRHGSMTSNVQELEDSLSAVTVSKKIGKTVSLKTGPSSIDDANDPSQKHRGTL